MANTLYTPEQVAKVAVAMAAEDSFLSALISRNFENDLLGGGGKGRTVNVKVPSALVARSRDLDATDAIVMDSLTESTIPVSLGEHLYNAVPLTEGEMNLDLTDFSAQVLSPQVTAVVERIENEVANALKTIPADTATRWDPANPVKTFTEIRRVLRQRGVPATNLNVVVGTDVYAALLDANAITDAGQSGSTEALREGNVGKLRGFTIAESTRVEDGEIVAFHRDAFTLAVRAPLVPAGQFGSVVSEKGFSLRTLRDYDVTTTQHRSMVSTFAGVAAMPLYRVTRDHVAHTASVTEVPGGAAFRMSIDDAEPV
jgi:hypothetical protein